MKYFLSIIFALSMCMCFAGDRNIIFPYKTDVEVTCLVSEPRTFQKIGQKYYTIEKSKVTWFDSLHLCRRFGGDLVLIESAEEMNALSSYLKSKGYGANDWFWTSGNDLIDPHNFLSATNGLPLPFTSWSAGQPDLRGVERCVHLWLMAGEFQMNNRACTEKAFYICQKPNKTRCTEDNKIPIFRSGET